VGALQGDGASPRRGGGGALPLERPPGSPDRPAGHRSLGDMVGGKGMSPSKSSAPPFATDTSPFQDETVDVMDKRLTTLLSEKSLLDEELSKYVTSLSSCCRMLTVLTFFLLYSLGCIRGVERF
jgi:hypothetical protein